MPANTTIGRVRIGQRQSTTIASPNWAVKTNVALADIVDVSTANVEDGFALIYNSVTDRYEMQPVTEFPNISGGIF
jgi:hypothetical protein